MVIELHRPDDIRAEMHLRRYDSIGFRPNESYSAFAVPQAQPVALDRVAVARRVRRVR